MVMAYEMNEENRGQIVALRFVTPGHYAVMDVFPSLIHLLEHILREDIKNLTATVQDLLKKEEGVKEVQKPLKPNKQINQKKLRSMWDVSRESFRRKY